MDMRGVGGQVFLHWPNNVERSIEMGSSGAKIVHHVFEDFLSYMVHMITLITYN